MSMGAASATVLTLAAVVSLPCLVAAQLVFTEEPANVTVQVGDSFTLRCSASVQGDAAAIIVFSWEKDGVIYDQGQQQSEEEPNTSMLAFSSATLEDAGSYVCMAGSGAMAVGSRMAMVTVTEAGDNTTVIAVAASVGCLGLLLIVVVLAVWLYVCLHKGHIWDKAPRIPIIRLTEEIEDLEKGCITTSTTLSRRSKSLSALKADSIFHHDAKMSLSIENLLPTSENDAYSLDPALDPDLEPNQNETLDYDLGLDESLFEHKKGTKSEGQLSNPPVPIQNQIRPLPIDDLSKKHRKHSDPYITYDQQTGTSLRPEHETLSLPRDLRSYPDFQVNQSHLVSRRTSATSDIQSDISSDFVTDHEGHSRSVRFDVGEDSGLESGPVTGASTPFYPPQSGRRASEPKCKVMNSHTERRGSAPECKSLGSSSHEDSDESLTRIDSVESQIMSSKSGVSVHSQDEGGRAETGESVAEVPVQESARNRDTGPGLEPTDTGDSKAQDSSQTVYTDGIPMPQDVIVAGSSDPELNVHGIPSTSIAHLIENWTEVGSELALHRPARSVEPVPGKKVATIKQKFQRETNTPGRYQPTPELNRPRLQLSQLVTDTTKQLFQEKPQEKNTPRVITRTIRQAARESFASDTSRDSESSSTSTLLQSTSSQLLTASGAQLDLADHSGAEMKRTKAEAAGETDEGGALEEHGSQVARDAGVIAVASASRLSTDLDTIMEESDMEVDSSKSTPAPSPTVPSPTVSPVPSPTLSPGFERRFHDIPIFTSPFTHTAWQPWHLQSSSLAPEPQYPNLLGFSNPAFDDDDDLENIDLGDFGDDRNATDDDALQPLLTQPLPPPNGPRSNFASISPIGKSLFSQRFLSRPPTTPTPPSTTPPAKANSVIRQHMLAIKDIKQAQLGTGEAFHPLVDYHKTRVNRLSTIPEESLSSSSSVDIRAVS